MTRAKAIRAACPDDESLAGLIENRLTDGARDEIERHVAVCPTCMDVIAAASPPAQIALQSLAAARTALAGVLGDQRRGAALRRGRLTRARRRLSLAAAVLLVSTAALGYLGARVGLGFARAELARRAGDTLGLRVAIGRMAVALGGDFQSLTLRLADVRVGGGDGDAMLEADVELSIALAPLWDGVVDVERIRLVELALELNQSDLRAPSPAAPARSTGLDTRRAAALVAAGLPVEIEAGTLNLRFPGDPPLRVEQLVAQSVREGDWVRFTLAGSTAGGIVTATGTLAAGDGRTFTVTVGGHGLALAGLPYLRNLVAGIGDVNLTIARSSVRTRVGGRILVRQGRTLGGNPIPALLAEAVRAGALAGLAPELTGNQLPFDEARAAFAWRGGAWRISRGFASSAGIDIAGTLRATEAGELEGEALLSLPPAVAEPLLASVPALARGRNASGGLTLPFAIAGTIDQPLFARRF